MAPIIKKSNTVHHWRCTKCGRTADSSVKPVSTYGGSCRVSSSGMHVWVKER